MGQGPCAVTCWQVQAQLVLQQALRALLLGRLLRVQVREQLQNRAFHQSCRRCRHL